MEGNWGEQHNLEGILGEGVDTGWAGMVPVAEQGHDNQAGEDTA